MMTSWTIHTTHAYPGRPDPDALQPIGEALQDYDAAVSAGQEVVHVDLALEAPGPIDAALRAQSVLEGAGLTAAGLIGLEVLSEVEAERRALEPTFPELAGGREVADLLGVSKQRLHQLLERKDFPDPVIRLAAGPVWLVASIRGFERGWARKPGRPAKVVEIVEFAGPPAELPGPQVGKKPAKKSGRPARKPISV